MGEAPEDGGLGGFSRSFMNEPVVFSSFSDVVSLEDAISVSDFVFWSVGFRVPFLGRDLFFFLFGILIAAKARPAPDTVKPSVVG